MQNATQKSNYKRGEVISNHENAKEWTMDNG
jgi:hypothetical protein